MKWMVKIVLVMVMSFVIGLAAPVGAQQARDEGGAQNEQSGEFQELYRMLEEKRAEIDLIEEGIAAASGDDREALEIRASELGSDLIEGVQALAAQVAAWEEQERLLDEDPA